jgi:hypothetical protein
MTTRAILGSAALLALLAGPALAEDFSLQRPAPAVGDVLTIADHWQLRIERTVTSDPILTPPPAIAPPEMPEPIHLTRRVTVRELDPAGHWGKLEVFYTEGAAGELAGRSFLFDLGNGTVTAADGAPISDPAQKRLASDRDNLSRILALDALLGGPLHEGETLAVPPAQRSILMSDGKTTRVTAMTLRLESVESGKAKFAVSITQESLPQNGQPPNPSPSGGPQQLTGTLTIDSAGHDLDLEFTSTSTRHETIPGFKESAVEATATVRLSGKRTIAPAAP